MKISKFSKPSAIAISAKQDFFTSNANLLSAALEINDRYSRQIARESCKNCEAQVGPVAFVSFGVGYSHCEACGHLNGAHEDSDAFVEFLYQADAGENYASNYLKAYDERVQGIYLPKVDFLRSVLSEVGGSGAFSVLDVGCGGGHFVKACELRGLPAEGVDPSASLVELAKAALATNVVRQCGMQDFGAEIETSEREVISMIGVLEHLQKPNDAIAAFMRSKARYLYISVPLFSLSCLVEHAFDQVYPRHLSGGHTHLYTEQSLTHLAERFGLKVIGEWWFGTDMVDLYRSLLVSSGDRGSASHKASAARYLGSVLDELQQVLDRHRMCSEVHMVFSKAT